MGSRKPFDFIGWLFCFLSLYKKSNRKKKYLFKSFIATVFNFRTAKATETFKMQEDYSLTDYFTHVSSGN